LSKGALIRVTRNEGGIKVEKPHRQAQMHQLGNFKYNDKRGFDKKPVKYLTRFCIS
jgi:hypothetical protein